MSIFWVWFQAFFGVFDLLLLFLCIIDERWKDSRSFKHFFLVVVLYTCQHLQYIVAIVDSTYVH